LLAQIRRTRFEHLGDSRTVRVMTNGAVLGHWLMIMYEWAAFFRVALEARFIHTVLNQLFGARRAMWIMAVRTAHFAF
jgi:hypothetical protein